MSKYKCEREIFSSFKKKIESDASVLKELEKALEVLLSEYNTTVYENRFVVGGVCEYFIGAAMRAVGIDAKNIGAQNERIDVQIPSSEGFSIKGSFTGKRDDIRLINSLGESKTREWSEATIFILSNMGIAYTDPELLPSATASMGDALVLKRRNLDEFLGQHPQYLIRCTVIPKSADIENTKVASEAIAKEILRRKEFPYLGKHIMV